MMNPKSKPFGDALFIISTLNLFPFVGFLDGLGLLSKLSNSLPFCLTAIGNFISQLNVPGCLIERMKNELDACVT